MNSEPYRSAPSTIRRASCPRRGSQGRLRHPVRDASPYIYVDTDDTLVRSFGNKRFPMTGTTALVRQLKERGISMYCWSSGGASYARAAADEVGLVDCFEAFLPKPHLLIDDMAIASWRLVELHPFRCVSMTVDDVLATLVPSPPGSLP